jgi:hypothetical protein
MANVSHASLTGANLHEPKGVASATINKVYVSDGNGSGTWQKLSPPQLAGFTTNGAAGQVVTVDGAGNFVFTGAPHGQIDFFNTSSPYTLTYPATYTKLAPTTTAGGVPSDFTEGTNARLTYTGTDTVPISFTYSMSVDQTVGTSRNIVIAIFKNGAITNGRSIATVSSGTISNIAGTNVIMAATNDYFELYAYNTGVSGDIRVYGYQLNGIFAGA